MRKGSAVIRDATRDVNGKPPPEPQRGVGDNNPPPALTAKVKLARIESIIERGDLTAAQKCIGVGIVVKANRDGVAEAKTQELMNFASVRDRETVFRATKILHELEVLEKANKPGQTGRYNVLPPKVIDAIVAAHEAFQSGRVKPAGMANETGQAKPDGVGGDHAVGSEPTGPAEPVRLNPTGQVEPDTPTPSPSRARVLDNNLNKTNTSPDREGEKERGFGGKPSESLDLKTKEGEAQEFAPPLSALEAFNLYNAMALRVSIPQARTLTPQRRKSLMARMREHGGIEAWKLAIANIEKSAFLQGNNDRGWTADLDFMLQAKSFTKLVEGTYGNGAHGAPTKSSGAGASRTKLGDKTELARALREIEEEKQVKRGGGTYGD